MNDLIRVPCVMIRGGTSKGPYFVASDLPSDVAQRDRLLLAAMGSGHEQQIDGIGGGQPVSSKVAIVGPSAREGIDVDYLFAQVKVRERIVDTSPNCGNMLAGVGPFAIEAGMVPVQDDLTRVRIFNINTKKVVEARVCTPGGRVVYDGDTAIDGVPGTAAPVHLAFLDAAGSKTAGLLPTGNPVDVIDGIEVTCVDAAMPVMLVRAADLGKTGYETPKELNEDREMLARLEPLRVEAGRRMGIANAADLVIPKPTLVAPPRAGGALSVRYFMPHQCHPTLAITGAVAISMAVATPDTIVRSFVGALDLPTELLFEHPAGGLTVRLEKYPDQKDPVALLVRTTRRLFEGHVLVSRRALEA